MVVAVSLAFQAACGDPGPAAQPKMEKAVSGPSPGSSARAAPPRHPQGFRGDGSGRFPEASPPLEWSSTRNLLWTTKIGPNKYSSPVVLDHRIYLVADPDVLSCLDATSGTVLWTRTNGFADLPDKVEEKRPRGDAGNTTPTPVTDGDFVYAVFGTGIVACYDTKGGRRWIRHFSLNPATEYGRAASPLLAGGQLLVTLSYLMALDPRTGKDVWKNKDVIEQYGTPLAAQIGGVDVAVMPSGQIVRLSDGALLASDLGGLLFASPIVQDGTVFLIQAGSIAQRLSAAGPDRWQATPVWEQELEGKFYASAVCDRGLIYAVSNEGKLYVLDSRDGKILVTRDLSIATTSGPAGIASANLYPSLALAGNHLFIFNDQGDALVLEPGRECRELRSNHLAAGHGSTPVFHGPFIYLRGAENLYCIGTK
jgi:outer membrane protein assembly factor BamB